MLVKMENLCSSGTSVDSKKAEVEPQETPQEVPKPLVEACFLCMSEEELTLCPDCKLVYYCGEVHRDIHRRGPDKPCFPFIVRSSQKTGR